MSKEKIKVRDGMRYNTNARRLEKKDFPKDAEATRDEKEYPEDHSHVSDLLIKEEQEKLDELNDLTDLDIDINIAKEFMDMFIKVLVKNNTPEIIRFKDDLLKALLKEERQMD